MELELLKKLQELDVSIWVSDDGELKVQAPKGILNKELVSEIKAKKEKLISIVNEQSHDIPKGTLQKSFPLTSSQKRLWFLNQFEGGDLAYNIPMALNLKGNLNLEMFHEAFLEILERHEILRARFDKDEQGTIYQEIIPTSDIDFSIELKDYSEQSVNFKINELLEKELSFSFDLDTAPLLKVTLFKKSENHHILFVNINHIICDGVSMNIIIQELFTIYSAKSNKESWLFPELSIQYKDYAQWLESDAQQDLLKEQETFWLQKLSGELPVLDLPPYKTRPKVKTYNGKTINHHFSKDFKALVTRFAQKNEATLFMTLMAGINGLFYRYTNSDDIILGTSVAGREHRDLEHQVGLFLNTLAIRTQFDAKMSFSELVKLQKKELLDAYSHQNYPFDELVNNINIKRDPGRSPLFDVLVELHQQKKEDVFSTKSKNDLQVSAVDDLDRPVSQFDMTFSFIETDADLILSLEYNTDVYDNSIIIKLIRHFEKLIVNAINKPDQSIDEVVYISEEELHDITQRFNTIEAPLPEKQTAIDVFESQVDASPNKIAVKFGNIELTYNEVNERANQLANYLKGTYNIDKDSLVILLMDRSELFLISILGIWKAGGAYIPLDPDFPDERIKDVLEVSQSKLILTEDNVLRDSIAGFINEENIEVVDNHSIYEDYSKQSCGQKTDLESLSYVIFTSGSTGKPKGAMIEHAGMLNHLLAKVNTLELDKNSIVAQNASQCFDISVWQLFCGLLVGGQTVIYSKDDVLNPSDFIREVQEDAINILEVVPSYLSVLMDYEDSKEISEIAYKNIKHLLVTGEALIATVANRWIDKHAGITLVNAYGPTEASDDITHYVVNKKHENSIPIGSVLQNLKIYILDDQLNHCGIGVKGELCVSGIGVGRGYLNDQKKTALAFVEDPFSPGVRMYKTGDIARYTDEGVIEFFGRKDFQVKIRGYRIELGEIENCILQQKSIVKNAVVDVREIHSEKHIVAYIIPQKKLDIVILKQAVLDTLPSYMVPSYFVEIDEIPLSRNGKVNRKELPEITESKIESSEYVPPMGGVEEELVKIWQDILKVSRVGITDNFFELGGHSLKAIQLINKVKTQLGYDLHVKDVFLHPTIEQLKQRWTETLNNAIPVAPLQSSYPLSSHQHRLWILSQFDGGNVAYNIPIAFWLEKQWNLKYLEIAFNELIKKHESLRTVFKEDETNHIKQFILPADEVSFNIDYDEISTIAEQGKGVQDIVKEASREEFDLSKGPLLKVKLIKFSAEKYLLMVNIHHIIADGWSMEIMVKEVLMSYKNLVNEEQIQIPSLEVQYKDYALWLQSDAVKDQMIEQETYWLQKFSGELPVLELPSFKSRPLVKTFNGNTFSYQFSMEVTKKLKKLSDKNQATLFMTLMAGVKGLFYRYTNAKDIIIGTPIAGRNHPDLENQIGLFLNTLAIRSQIKGTYTFEEWLQVEKQVLLDAYSNQEYPFDSLVNKLSLKRDTSRSALFDVMVELHNYQNMFTKKETFLGDLKISEVEDTNRGVSQFDMTFSFVEQEDNMGLFLEYNQDIFDHAVVESLVGHLENFLTSVVTNPNQTIDGIDYISPKEKEILFDKFKGDVVELPEQQTIVDVIESRVKETPNKIALRFENRTMTYHELNTNANRIAHRMSQEYGVSHDNLVCILMERSEWFVVAILAVWKSGGAYIPIDPDYPEQRIQSIINSSKSKLVLCIDTAIGDNLFNFFEENQIETLNPLLDFSTYSDQNLEKEVAINSLSYVIYTSGSTGAPKGAMVEHLGMLNHLYAKVNTLQLNSKSIVAQNASQCFDISVWQFFSALMTGGQTVIYSKQDILNPPSFIGKVFQDSITILEVVPSYLSVLMDYEDMNEIEPGNYKYLDYLMVTGETLIPAVANRWISKHNEIPIVNAYGPTEASDDITQYEFNTLHSDTIPIGITLQNLAIYILDTQDNLCGIGVKGELCVSGIGVGRGYLHNPEKTEAVFVEDPFRPDVRMYKTGDIARYRYDGTIEFFGRKDFQVKIRGHRIELGEIENTLLKQEELVKSAVVEVKEVQQQKSIVAYIVSNTTILEKEKIQKALESLLPYYMVPAYYIQLNEIPLTANGKVDRKVLPEVSNIEPKEKEIIKPDSKVEEKLLSIWQEILKIDTISTIDNFFELGGNSLSAGILMTKVKNEFKANISFSKFYINPTIKEIGQLITANEDISEKDLLIKLKEGEEDTPLFFIHPIGGNISSYELLIENLDIPNAVYGIQSQGLFTDQTPLTTVEEMASVYIKAIEKVQQEGPYTLLGWSFGGLIAYEIANQLQQKGAEIQHLFLIDSYLSETIKGSSNHAKLTTEKDIVSALLLEKGMDPIIVEQELATILEENQLNYLWSKVLGTNQNLSVDERQIIQQFLKVFRANEKAFYEYCPQRTELSSVHLYRATKTIDNLINEENNKNQWSKLISGDIFEVAIAGNHYSLVTNNEESKIIKDSIQTVMKREYDFQLN